MLRALQDPASPSYHRRLSPEDYASRSALRQPTSRVSAWLTTPGADGGRPLLRTSTARRLQRRRRRHRVGPSAPRLRALELDGARPLLRDDGGAKLIPADLQGLVLGLHAVNDFRPAPPRPTTRLGRRGSAHFTRGRWRGRRDAACPPLWPRPTSPPCYDLEFACIAGIERLRTETSPVRRADRSSSTNDITVFRSMFGLAARPARPLHLVPNTGAAVKSRGDVGEAMLDTEWAGAVAPAATIHYVYTGARLDNNGAFDLPIAVEQHIAPLVTLTWKRRSRAHARQPPSTIYEGMGDSAATSWASPQLVASGDSGAAGCDGRSSTGVATMGEFVGIPASIPSVVAVGGTEFQLTQANLGTYLDGALLNASAYIPVEARGATPRATSPPASQILNASACRRQRQRHLRQALLAGSPPRRDKFRDGARRRFLASASDEVMLRTSTVYTTTHHDGGDPASAPSRWAAPPPRRLPSPASWRWSINRWPRRTRRPRSALATPWPGPLRAGQQPHRRRGQHRHAPRQQHLPVRRGLAGLPHAATAAVRVQLVAWKPRPGHRPGNRRRQVGWYAMSGRVHAHVDGADGRRRRRHRGTDHPARRDKVSSTATVTALTGSVTSYVQTFDYKATSISGSTGSVDTSRPARPASERGTGVAQGRHPLARMGTGKAGAFYGGSWSSYCGLAAVALGADHLHPGHLPHQGHAGPGPEGPRALQDQRRHRRCRPFNIVEDPDERRRWAARVCSTLDDAGGLLPAGPVDGTVAELFRGHPRRRQRGARQW